MKFIEYRDDWPESFRMSYHYDLMEIYDKVPPNRLGYAYQYQQRKGSIIELVKKNLPVNSTILDVAAAQGNFSLVLAEAGYRVIWNDLRAELADYVKLKYEKGNIRYAPGNVFELNFEELFDAVIITEIIEHVAHPDQFLLKISKMVKKGGYIFMSTPNGAYFLNGLPKFTTHEDPSVFESEQFKPNADGHIFLIHPEELEWFSKQTGLRIKEIQLYSNILSNGHLKTSYLLRILPQSIVRILEKISTKLPVIISKRIHSGMSVVFKKEVV